VPNREPPGLGKTAQQLHAAEPYFSAVWKLVGGAAVGVLGGYFLDRWLGTTPWLLVALSTVGIAVGFYGFIHAMARMGKR
jgi:ATP synthase protein I